MTENEKVEAVKNKFCVATIFDSRGICSVKCNRPAKVIFEDKPYCGIHDPIKAKAKRAIRMKLWEEKWAIEGEVRHRKDLMEKILGNKTTKELEEMARLTPDER